MPKSDIFGNSPRTVRPGFHRRLFNSGSTAGFTLLELIVVLVLLGLVTALALPNVSRLYASVTRATERDYILDQFVGLGQKAMLTGQTYVVLGTLGEAQSNAPNTETRELRNVAENPSSLLGYLDSEIYQLDVPDGWQVRLAQPLIVRANGVCLGGELTLIQGGSESFRISLEPPYCDVSYDVGR
jgi:prepilin-type N-terminal cleavage/methylation domain-containing protein